MYLQNRIVDYLQSVEISHSFAKNFKHGVQTRDNHWDLFEPTRFIYAFFSFNMIYAIDWQTSLKTNRLKYHTSDSNAIFQILSLIEFIGEFELDAFEKALNLLDPKRDLYEVISKMDEDYNSSRLNKRKTGQTIAYDFKTTAKKFSDFRELDNNDHFDLLQMAYTVRNNLFHGEKKAHQMKEKGHRNRLLHYGNIILATNESFFEVMRGQNCYRRMEKWEIYENL